MCNEKVRLLRGVRDLVHKSHISLHEADADLLANGVFKHDQADHLKNALWFLFLNIE